FRMEAQLGLLKQFIACVKANPSMMNSKELAFFKEFIESYGGTVPADPQPEPAKAEETKKEEKKEEKEEKMEEDETPIPYPTLSDLDKVMEPETAMDIPMGDANKEMSDENQEKFSSERDEAMGAMGEGEYEKAMGHFNKAININPQSSMIFAKRAQCLLQMKKPAAAIKDASRAIELNADSANGYKWRGKGHRLLGHWVEAYTDFATALKIDYDDNVNEWMKEIESNAMKLKEYNRAVERQREEKELAERKERLRKAQEDRAKAHQRQQVGGGRKEEQAMGGGGMGGLGEFFNQLSSDPELKEAMKDPEVATAVMEIMQDPSALMKHMGNHKVMSAFAKLKGMFGGGEEEGHDHAHEEGGCCGGHGAPSEEGTTPKTAPSAPHTAPMPDLD
ncbi:hypothetical protein PENTCL1PPCAC_11686, partial [Pristionchus entomophagus]